MYIFFLDIDGTLVHGLDIIPEENIKAIEKVRALGHKVFINTGRGKAMVSDRIKALGDGLVSGIGTRIEYDGKVLFDKSMSEKDAHEVVDFVFSRKDENWFRLDCDEDSYMVGKTSHLLLGLEKNIKDKNELPDNFSIYKKVVFGSGKEEDIKFLSEKFRLYIFDDYAETAFHGISKGSAVEFLADYFNVGIENTVAIGDSFNDLEMLEKAGISVAMGNAPKELWQKCTFVTKDVQDCGVAYALQKITKNFTC